MNTIFSKSNDKVKFIKNLNEKKYRNKTNSFYLEGVKVVNEILDKAIDIEFIAYSKSILCTTNGGKELLNRIESIDVEVLDFDENIFKYVTDTVNPQGVLVVLKMPEYNLKEELEKEDGNILILDKIQDPGNMGTIIRSSNAFGVNVIICIKDTVDCYSPKVLRSTMGGILNTKIIYVEDYSFLNVLKESGYEIVATSLNANTSLETLNYKNKYAFAMGNEANGISKELENNSNISIKIPMEDKIESLNVSVATSIILYEQYKNKK